MNPTVGGNHKLYDDWIVTFVAKETFGLFLSWSRHDCSNKVTGERHHDDQEENNLGLWREQYTVGLQFDTYFC